MYTKSCCTNSVLEVIASAPLGRPVNKSTPQKTGSDCLSHFSACYQYILDLKHALTFVTLTTKKEIV